MTEQLTTNIKASRLRVARSRGAFSGGLLLVLGLWAGLIAFIGPYFDVGLTPKPDDTWKWTAARGWLEVLPGAAAVLGGLILLMSANRVVTSFGGWLAAAGGAWLVVGPTLAGPLSLDIGSPDPSKGQNTQAVIALVTFYAIGAAILLVAALALGRLSVHSVRDVRAAERRAEQDAQREETERQATEERLAADRERAQREQTPGGDVPGYGEAPAHGDTAAYGNAPAYGGPPQSGDTQRYPDAPPVDGQPHEPQHGGYQG